MGVSKWADSSDGDSLEQFRYLGVLNYMLWTIVVILVILWLVGVVTSTTLGGLVHLLLVIAIIVVVLNLVRGRRAL